MDARQARDHGARRRHGPAHRRARLVLLGALIAGVLAGCGSEAAEEPPAGGGAQPDPPATELTVTYWADGRDGPAQEATLTCDPAGGSHPQPEQACAALAADADALAPLPPDLLCTQIYGGPEEAEVTGTRGGEQVQATFSRQNGCEIDRWDRLAAVFQLGSS